ncbi:MAG: hypothetical protein KDB07_06730 [Planctomycetes bacterium]|nr:hypothetical protein [Planctomycetota bacterium]
MKKQLPLALVGAALSMTVLACAQSDPALKRSEEAAAKLPNMTEAEMALVRERCTACHNFAKVDKEIRKGASKDDWWAIVDDMAGRRGSPIRQSEIEPLAIALDKLTSALKPQ